MSQLALPGLKRRRPSRDLDDYYTPRRLAQHLVDALDLSCRDVVLEPSVGGGSFVADLMVRHTIGVDLDPEAKGLGMCDEHHVGSFLDTRIEADWIIGNPPYHSAEAFVRHALGLAPRVAFLLRLSFLESQKRAELWAAHPPARVVVLSERPSFTDDGQTDSSAYGWFIWDRDHDGPAVLEWLSWR